MDFLRCSYRTSGLVRLLICPRNIRGIPEVKELTTFDNNRRTPPRTKYMAEAGPGQQKAHHVNPFRRPQVYTSFKRLYWDDSAAPTYRSSARLHAELLPIESYRLAGVIQESADARKASAGIAEPVGRMGCRFDTPSAIADDGRGRAALALGLQPSLREGTRRNGSRIAHTPGLGLSRSRLRGPIQDHGNWCRIFFGERVHEQALPISRHHVLLARVGL